MMLRSLMMAPALAIGLAGHPMAQQSSNMHYYVGMFKYAHLLSFLVKKVKTAQALCSLGNVYKGLSTWPDFLIAHMGCHLSLLLGNRGRFTGEIVRFWV
jgi:hypothetical protein